MKFRCLSTILYTLALLSLPSVALTQVGVVDRQSIDSSGVQGNGSSRGAVISADGCIVGYASDATNLILGDTNGVTDLFGHVCNAFLEPGDDATVRVSFGAGGVETNGPSSNGHLLGGIPEFLAFASDATNLVTGDTNGTSDIFVIEAETFSVVTRVSVPNLADQGALGSQANAGSDHPSLGANHRFVVFESSATNLVPGDTNTVQDIFVHDRQTGETTRVSVDAAGVQGNAFSEFPVISGNGRFIAFASNATNLVTSDTNTVQDIFVHDRQTGATTRVSVPNLADQGALGTQGNSFSAFPVISADGRFVAFDSDATNLVAGDTNGTFDVFVHDRQTGETTRVSVDSVGTQGNSDSINPSISLRGRYVAFESDAFNLVASDTNAVEDIFVHDRQTGETTRVSVDSVGTQGNGASELPAISADGRFVAFESDATNLVASDTNALRDIFRAETGFDADPLPAISFGGIVNAASFAPFPAAVAPGSIVSVFGVNLAESIALAGSIPLPTTLAEGGISFGFDTPIVFVEGPLFFVSPNQMNIQVPFELTPGVNFPFATPVLFGLGNGEADINVAAFAPGLFATNQAGTGQGAILISNTGGVVAAPVGVFPTVSSRPVVPGDFITIFCTGLGLVTNQPATGEVASGSPLSTTTTGPTVTIGGVPATISFSGLAPNFVGLYQVNVEVPAGAPTGDAIDVLLTIGGATSNTVTIAVQ